MAEKKDYQKKPNDFLNGIVAGLTLLAHLGGQQGQPATPAAGQPAKMDPSIISPLPKGATSPNVTDVPSTANSYSKPHQYSKLDIEKMIGQNFPDDPTTARAVAMQESSLNPRAINEDNPDVIGTYQIDVNAHAKYIPGKTKQDKIDWLMDPANNIKFAKQLYDAQGWQPWEAYTSGAYKKYMDMSVQPDAVNQAPQGGSLTKKDGKWKVADTGGQ
jgi:hypothetical protein